MTQKAIAILEQQSADAHKHASYRPTVRSQTNTETYALQDLHRLSHSLTFITCKHGNGERVKGRWL